MDGRDAARTQAGLLARDHTLRGGVLFGLDGHVIELQARAMELLSRAGTWRSATTITGMPRGAVSEALDRISGAFSKYGVPPPEVEIVVNLAPPDLPKEGTWLDLPLAIIMLQAAGVLPDLPIRYESDFVLVGEVGLHGEIRRVPGVLSLAYISKPGQTLVVPAGNEKECALIMAKPGHAGCKVCPVSTLEEVIEFFRGKRELTNALGQSVRFESLIPRCADFARIKGQERAKEAALIAAAGGHNLLLIGPPGEGKSMLASAMPGILPRLSDAEIVELTRIYSACGELGQDGVAVTRRPMRAVHHTASKQAIIGGGSKIPQPGEVTLAHLGVLFMDEIAEFSTSTLETLRQPLEDGVVHISRVGATLTYPCRFTLVAAMNPCPCGYYGTERCTCKESDVKRYQSKLSGPIVDRIDLQVELQRLSTQERFSETGPDASPGLRARVESARERQRTRFTGTNVPFNAAIPGGHVKEFCCFSPAGFEHFRKTVEGATLTTRSMDRLAKVARTVADLDESGEVSPDHVDKAAAFVVGGMLRGGN